MLTELNLKFAGAAMYQVHFTSAKVQPEYIALSTTTAAPFTLCFQVGMGEPVRNEKDSHEW